MHLDMQTMSAVNVTVTAVLGGVLCYLGAGARTALSEVGPGAGDHERGLILSSLPVRPRQLSLGLAAIAALDALKWTAGGIAPGARVFCRFLGPVCRVALRSGYLNSFDHELGVLCTILAVYGFAARSLAGMTDEQLCWPAVILLLCYRLGVFVAPAQPRHADARGAVGRV